MNFENFLSKNFSIVLCVIYSKKNIFFKNLFKRLTKLFFIIGFVGTFFSIQISKSETKESFIDNKLVDNNYLESKKVLVDYIIDTGDSLFIDFYPAGELSGFYKVNEEGGIYLPRLKEVNVVGLTPSELEILLKESYSKFLLSPNIKVKIAIFREIKVTVSGEVRYPGSYTFPAYESGSIQNFINYIEILKKQKERIKPDQLEFQEFNSRDMSYFQNANTLDQQFAFKKDSKNITNISDAIRKGGGITSLSDLRRIRIVRNVPLSKGGGKKAAVINLEKFLNEFDTDNDLRLFDGDQIFIPLLESASKDQISKSVVSGLSPRFIEVNVFGRVENSGTFKLPLQGTLSDAIDITGPIKPLSGKVLIIRYNSDGKLSKKRISYSANAPRGSSRNPFVKEGDLITVTNSVLGKTTGVIREFTAPFFGIYSAKELIEDLSD